MYEFQNAWPSLSFFYVFNFMGIFNMSSNEITIVQNKGLFVLQKKEREKIQSGEMTYVQGEMTINLKIKPQFFV